jgi:hypothetical protein
MTTGVETGCTFFSSATISCAYAVKRNRIENLLAECFDLGFGDRLALVQLGYPFVKVVQIALCQSCIIHFFFDIY